MSFPMQCQCDKIKHYLPIIESEIKFFLSMVSQWFLLPSKGLRAMRRQIWRVFTDLNASTKFKLAQSFILVILLILGLQRLRQPRIFLSRKKVSPLRKGKWPTWYQMRMRKDPLTSMLNSNLDQRRRNDVRGHVLNLVAQVIQKPANQRGEMKRTSDFIKNDECRHLAMKAGSLGDCGKFSS